MSLHPFYPIFDDVAWLRRMRAARERREQVI